MEALAWLLVVVGDLSSYQLQAAGGENGVEHLKPVHAEGRIAGRQLLGPWRRQLCGGGRRDGAWVEVLRQVLFLAAQIACSLWAFWLLLALMS